MRTKGRIELFKRYLKRVINSDLWYKIILSLFTFLITFMTVLLSGMPVKYDFKVDDVSEIKIFAPRDVENKIATEKLRTEAENRVPIEYIIDEAIFEENLSKISAFFAEMRRISAIEYIDIERKITEVKRTTSISLSNEVLAKFFKISQDELLKIYNYTYDIYVKIGSDGIEENISNVILARKVKEETTKLILPAVNKELIESVLLSGIIKSNKRENVAKTESAKQAARAGVLPVIYKKGEKLIDEGHRITEEDIAMLTDLSLMNTGHGIDYKFMLSIFLLNLFGVFLLIYYYYFNKNSTLKDKKNFTIFCITFILDLIIIFSTLKFRDLNVYLVPISVAPMLIAILLDVGLAVVLNLILCFLCHLMSKSDINFIFFLLFSGTFSVFLIAKGYKKNRLVSNGIALILLNTAFVLSFSLFLNHELKVTINNILYSALNTIMSIIIAIGLVPVLESIFKIVTPLRLLEISNPNNPLIKKLLLEAPGTYHHCLMVGNLAEAALEAIDGNTALGRAGAYYHDIGKIQRPSFYIENQYNKNPHDELDAITSKEVIMSHITYGIELAKEYRLPNVITDIIREHHGTSLVSYFYHKAKQQSEEPVNEKEFRYKGPVPSTKESAVIMLADCIEAVVRAECDRNPHEVEDIIRNIVKAKLEDGQLRMSNLTLTEIEIIIGQFVNVFSGFFHSRIEYPKG